MSATASELVERAHDVVQRLSVAIQAGRSAAHLQLICSELFEALRAELGRAPVEDTDQRELLSTTLILCKRSGDPALNAQLRLAQLRAVVALLKGGTPSVPAHSIRPRFQVIQGGLS